MEGGTCYVVSVVFTIFDMKNYIHTHTLEKWVNVTIINRSLQESVVTVNQTEKEEGLSMRSSRKAKILNGKLRKVWAKSKFRTLEVTLKRHMQCLK